MTITTPADLLETLARHRRDATLYSSSPSASTSFVVMGVDEPALTLGKRAGRIAFEFATVPTAYRHAVATDLAARWNAENPTHPVKAVTVSEWVDARLREITDLERQIALEAAP